MNWGLDLAKRDGLDCFLFASPITESWQFYRKRGFEDVGSFEIRLGGEEGGGDAGGEKVNKRSLMQKKCSI